jgi:hypothetical protein
LRYIKDINHVKIELSLQELKGITEQKLIIFRDKTSTVYQEIFPEFARPVKKLEANIQDFNIK